MEKELKLVLTFKQSEKYIYDEIQNHSAKGGWVKDILRDYIEQNKKAQNKPK